MCAAVLFLSAYAVPIISPHVDRAVRHACWAVQWSCWALFAVDYVARLALSHQRGRWFVRHLLDLAVIALPMLRPLRLLRLVTLLHVFNRGATSTLRGRVVAYVVGGAVLLSFVAALAATDAERGHPGANINSFGDAWWWAISTMTTVGYGDRYPVTTEGRFVAIGLMISGIALLGTVTATLASWLSDRVRSESDATTEILAELRELRAIVEKQNGDGERP
ncbi:two pore domain potassium channel family protein [Allobranchiibius sp. CTAmp26]|nr:two pore domain potassium channel family protein [Allobranchiibius sp. CTAmp26]